MTGSRRRIGNLPAETSSLIGRRRELADVRRKLEAARLVTLVGPGGVGKTRLALRAATDLARGVRDGTWVVELADVHDPDLVVDAVMGSLDLRAQAAIEPLDVLRSHVRDRELLLVLDNCEHLLGAVARVVVEVLRVAPDVRVLATSREPLTVAGEHVVSVPTFELPSPETADPTGSRADIRRNDAVALFVERATAASGEFALTDANQAAVVELCRRLDGLPLAIELAAVRSRSLSVDQIVARLADRFDLLSGGVAASPRQQTLRTTIDWSHDLLAPDEREVLRRLSVFGGRFTVGDVESVCSSPSVPEAHIVGVLASLVERSFVMRGDADAQVAYRLHETMREYARLELQAAGEEPDTQRRCVEHYRVMCLRSAVDAPYRLPEWFVWMTVEIDNVRAVLGRCLATREVDAGLDIAGALGWYWSTRATVEGARWLDDLLALASDDPAASSWARFTRGFLAVAQGDPVTARSALRQAASAARIQGRPMLLSLSLSAASIVENMAGRPEAARKRLIEAGRIADALGEPSATLGLLHAQALDGLFRGDLDATRSASLAGEQLSRDLGALYVLELNLTNLGFVALASQGFDAARRDLVEALGIAQRIDDRVGQSYLLAALGCLAADTGQAALAARLLGGAEMVRVSAGATVMSSIGAMLARAEGLAIDQIGGSTYEAELATGRRSSREETIRLALGGGHERPPEALGPAAPGLLGRRASEVAALVADGLTNKEIGTRLFISERTVDGHVRIILDRLGFDSRTQIAAWVATSASSRPD